MRWFSIFFLSASLLMTPSLFAQSGQNETPGETSQEQIDSLIGKLGSRNFAVRARAKAELEKIGAKALPALQKAIDNDDLEISSRAKQLVAKIEADHITHEFLAAKSFHFNLENVTVEQAIRELRQKSGYKIELTKAGDDLLQKKISLKLGETTFWQAFDAICSEAGLVRHQTRVKNDHDITPWQGIRPPNIRIRQVPNIKILPIPKIQVPKNQKPNNKKKPVPKLQIQRIPIPIIQPLPVPNGLQVQIQKKPAAFVPIQIQRGGAVVPTETKQIADDTIHVKPGTAPDYPTYYAGSVRIRLIPTNKAPKNLISKKRDDEILLVFEVMGEPRLKEFRVDRSPALTNAVDDQGQELLLAPEQENQNPNGRVVGGGTIIFSNATQNSLSNYAVLRLKRGEKKAKFIKTLQGTLSVGALGEPKELLAINNVMDASGKTVKDAKGHAMQLQSIQKKGDQYEVVVNLEQQRQNNNLGGIIIRGGNVRIQGRIIIGGNGRIEIVRNRSSDELPALVDEKGKHFKLVGVPNQRTNINNGHQSQTVTMIFEPQEGQGEPQRLVLTGATRQTVSVPFTFRNVPLR